MLLTSDNVIFSKSGCVNCHLVEQFLTEEGIRFDVVMCDDLLAVDREAFLKEMTILTGGVTPKSFPMVFLDGKYVGGYKQTIEYCLRP